MRNKSAVSSARALAVRVLLLGRVMSVLTGLYFKSWKMHRIYGRAVDLGLEDGLVPDLPNKALHSFEV